MRLKLLITLLCCMSYYGIHAQDYSTPKFDDDIEEYYWPDEDSSNQIKLWENGKVKTNYESIDDQHKWRFDFNENGTLKFKVKVYQELTVDTSAGINLDTYEEYITISKGISDVPDGEFESYFYYGKSADPKIKTSGKYAKGVKTGEWLYRDYSSNAFTTTVNYKQGNLHGKYTVFYPSKKKDGENIRYVGNYKTIESSERKRYSYRFISSRRVGTWNYYDKKGKLLETVMYKQVQE